MEVPTQPRCALPRHFTKRVHTPGSAREKPGRGTGEKAEARLVSTAGGQLLTPSGAGILGWQASLDTFPDLTQLDKDLEAGTKRRARHDGLTEEFEGIPGGNG